MDIDNSDIPDNCKADKRTRQSTTIGLSSEFSDLETAMRTCMHIVDIVID